MILQPNTLWAIYIKLNEEFFFPSYSNEPKTSQMWLLPCCDITGSQGLHQKDRDWTGRFFYSTQKKYLVEEEKQNVIKC